MVEFQPPPDPTPPCSSAAGFLARFAQPLVVDEVRRAPELLLAVKAAMDRKRLLGRFLLAGSASVLQVPRAAESLAGRVEIVSLWPFSQGEIEGAEIVPFGAAPFALLVEALWR